jgi:hypothetical protein
MEATMEIRKSNSIVSTVTQESASTESEKSVKARSAGIASAKDSFEVSSSSNQENSGTKNLSTAQQQEASKFNKDPENSGSTSQNGRATYEDAKNSGLAGRLGHNKESNEADSKRQLPNGVTVGDIRNSQTQTEQTSAAVSDAQQKLNGDRTNYRESLDQELARRRQDITMMGGSSAMDRAYSAHNPTATPKGKGEVPTGAAQVAYAERSERKNKDGSITDIITEKIPNDNGGTTEKQYEFTVYKDLSTLSENKETEFHADNSKSELDTKTFFDRYGNVTKTVTTEKAYGDGKLLYSSESTTIDNKDGSSTTTTTTKETNPDGSTKETSTKTTTPPSYGFDGSKGGSYGYMPLPPGVDDDRAAGDIPDYIRNQINQTKPKKGGETELTDGGVTGNSADGSGPINNAFTRTGGVMGAVAQPTRAGEYVGGPSNGTVGSAVQNGGATDSLDGSSWTGTTHQDDPADVQFGPSTPAAGSVDSKKTNEDSDDSDSNSSLQGQILNRKTKKAE